MRRFTSIYIHTSHFGLHIEIKLQDVPNREYTLRLFVENVDRELEKKDNYTWIPAQRQYVPYYPNMYTHWWMCVYRDISPISQIHAEVRMKRGHSIWATYREGGEVININGLFRDYWGSNDHEFTLLGQSLSPPACGNLIEENRGCHDWKI